MTWDPRTAAVTAAVAAVVGLGAGRCAIGVGLSQLGIVAEPSVGRLPGPASVAMSGVLGIAAAYRTGSPWYVPGLLLWAYALAVLGVCDAIGQRIPTPFCRQATVATLLLLIGAGTATRDWRGLGFAALGALISSGLLTICVRFLGVGRGDRRLSVLGGLGLGHITTIGLILGVLAFALILSVQAALGRRANRNRPSGHPLGAALGLGFLLAAAA